MQGPTSIGRYSISKNCLPYLLILPRNGGLACQTTTFLHRLKYGFFKVESLQCIPNILYVSLHTSAYTSVTQLTQSVLVSRSVSGHPLVTLSLFFTFAVLGASSDCCYCQDVPVKLGFLVFPKGIIQNILLPTFSILLKLLDFFSEFKKTKITFFHATCLQMISRKVKNSIIHLGKQPFFQ